MQISAMLRYSVSLAFIFDIYWYMKIFIGPNVLNFILKFTVFERVILDLVQRPECDIKKFLVA